MDRIENQYRHEQLIEVPLRVHRKREPFKAAWCDGPFAIVVGVLTFLFGAWFGTSTAVFFFLGTSAFVIGLLSAEVLHMANILVRNPPIFSYLNRLYAAIRIWSRTRTAIIATKYRVGQRVETLSFPGCMSRVTEICAYRGKIYYRLNGFTGDYREHELKEG